MITIFVEMYKRHSHKRNALGGIGILARYRTKGMIRYRNSISGENAKDRNVAPKNNRQKIADWPSLNFNINIMPIT
jgi:hypothetical protein